MTSITPAIEIADILVEDILAIDESTAAWSRPILRILAGCAQDPAPRFAPSVASPMPVTAPILHRIDFVGLPMLHRVDRNFVDTG
jgi:hypothetical protein